MRVAKTGPANVGGCIQIIKPVITEIAVNLLALSGRQRKKKQYAQITNIA